jgi:AAA+ superfamily predicted ATPase
MSIANPNSPLPPGAGSPWTGLLTRLRRLDRLIQARVDALRRPPRPEDEFRGLYISEEEVDRLLARAPGAEAPSAGPEAPSAEEPARVGEAGSRLDTLSRLFGLSALEEDCLLVCLSPEIDPRYERLYAYLQDDVTKRRPSVDLVLDLLCPTLERKISGRRCFLPGAPLVRQRLVQLFEDPAKPHPTLLGRYLRLDDRVAGYLLGCDEIDARLLPFATCSDAAASLESMVLSGECKERLARLVEQGPARLFLYLQGRYGSGRRTIAEALSRNLCLPTLVVNVGHMAGLAKGEFLELAQLAVREAELQPAALFLSGFDSLLGDEKRPLLEPFLRELDTFAGPCFASGEEVFEPADELRNHLFVRLELPRTSFAERSELWTRFAGAAVVDFAPVATKFRFTPGQIEDAAAAARNLALWRDPATGQPNLAEFYEACRQQSNRKLSALARKIKPNYTWDQIILPSDRIQQLREICNSVKHRAVVYDQWGFDRKLSLGKGLNVLFAGPPGTGKTMAAEIIAGELALDVYKIDLSCVVSKYIGETEKNLSRIFLEAETSNAILFFDEADALFGKRSEVRDAHDRYANIEVGYLLQKMEEYEGVVILATNFRKNMDEAFVRRMHFTVEFPLPGQQERLRIWENIWPAGAPRGEDLDLEYVSRRFELSGGNVRNIALGAAFLAADNGGVVNMTHLLHAMRREYQKMGKVIREAELANADALRPATRRE